MSAPEPSPRCQPSAQSSRILTTRGVSRSCASAARTVETSIPLGDLPEDSRAWERGVAELAEEDEDVAEYVRNLEESQDASELPEASGEAIAREFERYLKRRENPDD